MNKVIVAWVFGAMWSAVALGAPIVGYFNRIGASTFAIGLVGAMPAIATLIQPLASYTLERTGHRRRIFVAVGCVHRLLWLVPALLPLFISDTQVCIQVGLGILAVSFLLGSFASPFWITWVADLVPANIRGTFFGRRANLGQVSGVLAAVLVGQYLAKDPPLYKFAVGFTVAGIAGFIDILIHRWVPDIALPPRTGHARGILKILLEPARNRNFRSFLGFVLVMWLGAGMVSAYVNLYLVRELSLSYLQIALYMTVLSGLAHILFSELFGVCIDQFGNKPVLVLSAFATVFFPIILIFCRPQSHLLLALVGISGGAAWAGLNLTVLNLQIGLPPPERRHTYAAAFGILTGVSGAVGALLGAAIATAVQDVSVTLLGIRVEGLHFVFLASVMLRVTSLPFLKLIQEPEVKGVGYVVRALGTLNPFRSLFNIYAYQRPTDEQTRAHAVHGLGRRGGTLGLSQVISALDDSSRVVREEAARTLGDMAVPEGVEPLIEKLKDPGSLIQSVSASSLGKIKDPRSVPPLVDSLASQDREVRGAAAGALGDIGDHSAVQPLLDLMKRESDSFVFASGADALGRLGEAQAILIILPALERMAHPIVRKQLAVAVGNVIGTPGEFYKLISAEERIEGLGASRLVSDSRRLLSRWSTEQAQGRALEALQVVVASLYEEDTASVLDALNRGVSTVVEEALPEHIPWYKHIEDIWRRDPKLGCQLVFLDYIFKRKDKAAPEEILLALYALRCLCRRLLANGRGSRNGGPRDATTPDQ
jgi:MFS family permease